MAFAHWQSFRNEIFRHVTDLNVDALVFDTLQAAILVAVIFCAGGTLQAIEVLSEYFVNRGPIFDVGFGEKLLVDLPSGGLGGDFLPAALRGARVAHRLAAAKRAAARTLIDFYHGV